MKLTLTSSTCIRTAWTPEPRRRLLSEDQLAAAGNSIYTLHCYRRPEKQIPALSFSKSRTKIMFSRLRSFQAAQSLLALFQPPPSSGVPLPPVEQPSTSIICKLSEDVFYLIFAMLDSEDLLNCGRVRPYHTTFLFSSCAD